MVNQGTGRNHVREHVPPGKPFDISKQEVWQAYLKVAANKGAAGVDMVGLEEFESDLKNNLYKIWNRMSSGSYFPPRLERWKSRRRMEREPGCSAFPLLVTG